jgi:phosphoribosylaminoimidazole-succinocarboxamide synthase
MDGALIDKTDFHFPGQKGVYRGKVRDVYDLGDSLLFVASDRYSAFDRNLALIPHKGELVSAISHWWFDQTRHIIENHIKSYPDPNVTWGIKCKTLPVEVVVRGYITGVTNTSLWYNYSAGQRDFGSFSLPDGLTKNQKLPEPVLTPTTKSEIHDRPLTPAEVISEGHTSQKVWDKLEKTALELFKFGQETAEERGLILVDTKYEFGLRPDGEIVLIDEIHTPDSSRYWRADTYQKKLAAGKEPDNYDKEFLRLWFKDRSDPYKDKELPTPPEKIIQELSNRYKYVYEKLAGQRYIPASGKPLARIETNVLKVLRGA